MRQQLFRLIIGAFLLTYPLGYASAAEGHKEILVLHSYSQGLEWTDNITMGILNTLANSEYSDILFHFEYMDTKSYFSPGYLNQLYDIFQKKFKNKHFDVIISSDDDAFNFLLERQPKVFTEFFLAHAEQHTTQSHAGSDVRIEDRKSVV